MQFDDTPIELHQADVIDRLEREGERAGTATLSMRSIFSGRRRSEMIGLFLAVLELIRQRRVRASADDSVTDIHLELLPPADPEPDPEIDADGTIDGEPLAEQRNWDDDHIFDDEDEDDDEFESSRTLS